MGNYVRAAFCVKQALRHVDLLSMLEQLAQENCTYNVVRIGRITGYLTNPALRIEVEEQQLDPRSTPEKLQQLANLLSNPGYLDIELGWRANRKTHPGRLIQMWREEMKVRALSLCIEEDAFLPGNQVEFIPNNSLVFEAYKGLLIEFARSIKPFIGVSDYEADLICQPLDKVGSLVSWSNFYSSDLLANWTNNDVNVLINAVDEYYWVDNLGLLTFIHPLTANQAWTNQHEEIHALLQRVLSQRL